MRNELRLVSLLLFWLVPRVAMGSEKQPAPQPEPSEPERQAVADEGRASELAPKELFLTRWRLSIPGAPGSDGTKAPTLARALRFDARAPALAMKVASLTPPPMQFVEDGAPRYELSGEYVFLSDLDLDVNFPFGWNFSFARNFSSSLGVVGEVGASYKSEQGADLTIWDFLGGVRFSRRSDSTVTPYVEVLGGLARATASAGGLSESGTDPAIQGGGGVDLKIQQNASIRVGVDYRAIFSDVTLKEVRVRAGVVFGFGGTTGESVAVEPAPPPPAWEQPIQQPPPPRRLPEPPPPPVAEPQPSPAPQPAPRPTAPAPPPAPESAFDRGRALLRSGDFEGAASFFMDHLRREGGNRFTVAIGLFCDRDNVAAHVINSGYAPELLLLSVPRRGQSCFGVYWGLFDSRQEAQRAIDSLPAAIRSPSGHVVLAASRLIR